MTVYLPGFEGERKAIEEYFTDAWLDGPYALVPLAYDNIPFVSPKPPDPYVELVIRPASSEQISLGDDPLLLFTGLVLATAHVPAGEGTKEARALIDYVGGLLSRKVIENIAAIPRHECPRHRRPGCAPGIDLFPSRPSGLGLHLPARQLRPHPSHAWLVAPDWKNPGKSVSSGRSKKSIWDGWGGWGGWGG